MRAIHWWLALQSCQGIAKASAPARQRPDNISDIELLHPASGEQGTERLKIFRACRDKNESRGIPIQTMDQSQLGAAGLKSADQGIALMVTKTGLAQQP